MTSPRASWSFSQCYFCCLRGGACSGWFHGLFFSGGDRRFCFYTSFDVYFHNHIHVVVYLEKLFRGVLLLSGGERDAYFYSNHQIFHLRGDIGRIRV